MEKILKFFESQVETIILMQPENAGRLLYACIKYFANGDEPTFEDGSTEKILWPGFKHSIDVQIRDSKNGSLPPKEGGRKRGRPKKDSDEEYHNNDYNNLSF